MIEAEKAKKVRVSSCLSLILKLTMFFNFSNKEPQIPYKLLNLLKKANASSITENLHSSE